jgi:hypothetical protein
LKNKNQCKIDFEITTNINLKKKFQNETLFDQKKEPGEKNEIRMIRYQNDHEDTSNKGAD